MYMVTNFALIRFHYISYKMASVYGLEPQRTVLETAMLPLHHTEKTGAEKETRTLDLMLGKHTLYQLSYSRIILQNFYIYLLHNLLRMLLV